MAFASKVVKSAVFIGLFAARGGYAVDVGVAQTVAKQNNCFRCHGVDKDKDGPAWRKIAAKFKGDAKAVDKLEHQMTAAVKVKFADGHEESHPVLKTADKEQVKNLIDWILSL